MAAICLGLNMLRVPRVYVWYPRKLPVLTFSRCCVMQGFAIIGLNFLDHECASMFLTFVQKYRKYAINRRWRVLYVVCAPAIISLETVDVFQRKLKFGILPWKFSNVFKA